MGTTNIEWTDAVWNPVVGCRPCSGGCARCYAERMSKRIAAMATADIADGKNPGRKRHYLNVLDDKGRFNGQVQLVPESLGDPLGWRTPRKVFVNSMSDLFYGDEADSRACEAKGVPFTPVPFEYIDKVFVVMAQAEQHTLQVLTKRIGRMEQYLSDRMTYERFGKALVFHAARNYPWMNAQQRLVNGRPLRNVILGVSVEDGRTAEARLPALRRIRQAGWATFVSYEPALGPVDWQRTAVFGSPPPDASRATASHVAFDWLISGGESGPDSRPSHPDWHRAARDFCARTGTAYLFKQWGAWRPTAAEPVRGRNVGGGVFLKPSGGLGCQGDWWDGTATAMDRVGKKLAGRLLDGRTHDEFPTTAAR